MDMEDINLMPIEKNIYWAINFGSKNTLVKSTIFIIFVVWCFDKARIRSGHFVYMLYSNNLLIYIIIFS
jgi:hypothetical protein